MGKTTEKVGKEMSKRWGTWPGSQARAVRPRMILLFRRPRKVLYWMRWRSWSADGDPLRSWKQTVDEGQPFGFGAGTKSVLVSSTCEVVG